MAGTSNNRKLLDWVEHWRDILEPDDVVWCDGSERGVRPAVRASWWRPARSSG